MKKFKLEPLGLITHPAKTTVPGACTTLDNFYPRRPKKVQSRPGHKYEAAVLAKSRSLFAYGGSVFGLFQDSTLQKLTAGVWAAVTGTFATITPIAIATFTGRPRAVLAGDSLYVLANAGVTRLAGPSDTPLAAGAPPGLSFDRLSPAAVLVTAGGFLTDQYQVAYRYEIAIRDAKGVTHVGSPSSRTIVANATYLTGWVTTESKNVVLRLLLPAGCTTAMFFRVYRSKQVPLGTQPDDDEQLVYQDYLTTGNVAAGYVEFTDVYSEALPKGAYIHTSPNFAKAFGLIDGENGLPPVAMDGCVFKDRLFLFNLMGYSTYQLTILGAGGTAGIQNGDVIQIGSRQYTATTGAPSIASRIYFLCTAGSAYQNIEQTALNLVQHINADASGDAYAIYVSGPDDLPGKILLRARTPNIARFFVVTDIASKRTCFDPVLQVISGNFTLTRAGTTVTATIVAFAGHNFRVGEQVTNGNPDATWAAGPFTILTVTGTTFTYTDASSVGAGPSASKGFALTTNESLLYSKYDIEPNAFAYSKPLEFGAFPVRNRGYAGDKSVTVGRVVPLRDSIVVWTYQGLGRITGDSPETLSFTWIDQDARLLAPESVQRMGDVAIGWTTKGVIEVSDTGWRILSDDITPTLELLVQTCTIATVRAVAFGVALSGQRIYELFVPALSTDTTSSFAYVYCYATNRWCSKSPPYLLTCGMYRPDDDKGWWGDARANGYGVAYSESTILWDDIVTNPASPSPVATAIIKTLVMAPFAGGDTGAYKNWQEFVAEFEGVTPVSLSYVLTNELGLGDAGTITPADSSPMVRFWASFLAAGARIAITLLSQTISEECVLIAIDIYWEEFGPAVMR